MSTEIQNIGFSPFDTLYIIRRRVIAKMGGVYPACQDVESEAMLRFVKAMSVGKFKNNSELKTYIISITDCAIADYFRKAYKENPAKLPFLWDLVDDTLDSMEVKEIVEESFKVLSDEQKKAIVYTEIYGMSRDEAAKTIGVTKERLGSIKTDAKRKMKRRLVKMGFGMSVSLVTKKRIAWLRKFFSAYESICKKSDYGNDAMLHDARQAYEGIKGRLEER